MPGVYCTGRVQQGKKTQTNKIPEINQSINRSIKSIQLPDGRAINQSRSYLILCNTRQVAIDQAQVVAHLFQLEPTHGVEGDSHIFHRGLGKIFAFVTITGC